jgi:hypothetical protein
MEDWNVDEAYITGESHVELGGDPSIHSELLYACAH